MRILIAEDDRTCSRILQAWLVKWGYEVEAVATGPAAFEALDAPGGPRLAILDWEMPGLDGPDVCRKIRAKTGVRQPYLLLVTAKEGKEHIAAGIRAGANDYLSKPFDPDELRVRLDVGVSLLEKEDLASAARELERRVEEGTAELATANAYSQLLLASIPCLLVGLDAAGRVTKWNRTAEEVFSLPAADTLGRPFAGLGIQWDHTAISSRAADCVLTRRPTRLEHVSFASPGRNHGVLDLTLAPIVCPGQDVALGVLLLGEDRTTQRLLEEQLKQAQKLESVGHLAAGVAHEINTPIQYIGDNTNFLAGAFRDVARVLALYREAEAAPERLAAAGRAAEEADVGYLMEEVPRAINQTLEGVQHVARIVKAMKEFAHPGTEEKTPVDLNHALETVIAVARNEWKYVAEVVTDFDPNLPMVSGVAGELNQVFLNLLVNAAHAVQVDPPGGKKGTITISTRQAGNLVEVRVADTGCGIPEAIRGRVFDPFFTTKPVGQGTGQGLAMAHAVVVQRHGGAITLESEVDRGTTFVVRLPVGGGSLSRSERIKSVDTARVPATTAGRPA